MDKAAGKPAGYFADLKGRQSNLIKTEKILNKRIKQLSGAQAVSEVTPRMSKENVSLFAHSGMSAPSAIARIPHNALFPPRELAEASMHVRKAFPGPEINTLPYQALFSDTARGAAVAHQLISGERKFKMPAPLAPRQEQNPTDAWAGTGVQ
jgi:hypothetical protein